MIYFSSQVAEASSAIFLEVSRKTTEIPSHYNRADLGTLEQEALHRSVSLNTVTEYKQTCIDVYISFSSVCVYSDCRANTAVAICFTALTGQMKCHSQFVSSGS